MQSSILPNISGNADVPLTIPFPEARDPVPFGSLYRPQLPQLLAGQPGSVR